MSKKVNNIISNFRHITNGSVIPETGGYCDQPYIVKTDDGAWLLAVTSGLEHEGKRGQTVLTMRSTDYGVSWHDITEIEPSNGPETSYAVLLKAPYGRIFCFYNHNTDNIRVLDTAKSGLFYRVDSQGHYVFKYSDDHGRTWSKKRYEIPQRSFEIDLNNHHKGEIKYFWNVGAPFVKDGVAYCSIHKIGEFGNPGGYVTSEGALLRCANFAEEKNPEKLNWETLPEGLIGIRAPENGGEVAEEQKFVPLSDGSLMCIYRTVSGHPARVYSRDDGRSFTAPEFMSYPDGRLVKHPRAANFVWKCSNGKYLYWFHNNGSKGYNIRNPVWILGGVEADSPDGKIVIWSQPEMLLYDDEPVIRISYPDLIEDNGGYYFSETQKCLGRIHRYEPEFFEAIWAQFENGHQAEKCTLELTSGVHPFKNLPVFYYENYKKTGAGGLRSYTGLTFIVEYSTLSDGEVLFSTLTSDKKGMELSFSENNFRFYMSDGQSKCIFDTDENFIPQKNGHICVIVDSGPCIVSFVSQGKFCDGGDRRINGWLRFSPFLYDVAGANNITVSGSISKLRYFERAVMVSDCVRDFNYSQSIL